METLRGHGLAGVDCSRRLFLGGRLFWEIVLDREIVLGIVCSRAIVCGDCSGTWFGGWSLFAETGSARDIVLGDCSHPRDCLEDCFCEGDCLWIFFKAMIWRAEIVGRDLSAREIVEGS